MRLNKAITRFINPLEITDKKQIILQLARNLLYYNILTETLLL